MSRRLLLAVLALGGCRADPPAPPDGAAVYAMACARCHGPRGAGDGPLAARLGPIPDLRRPIPATTIAEIVRTGRGAMPAHQDRLTPAQIEAVAGRVSQWGR